MKKIKKKKGGIALSSSLIMISIITIVAFVIFPGYFKIFINREISSALRHYSMSVMQRYSSAPGSKEEKLTNIESHMNEFLIERFKNLPVDIVFISVTVEDDFVGTKRYEDPASLNNGDYTEHFYAIYGKFKITTPIEGKEFELEKTLFRHIN